MLFDRIIMTTLQKRELRLREGSGVVHRHSSGGRVCPSVTNRQCHQLAALFLWLSWDLEPVLSKGLEKACWRNEATHP